MATRQQAFEEARRLVVAEGFSYADAATMTALPLSTLQKRAADEGWQKMRETASSYGTQVKAMKANLMERIGNLTKADGDAQQIAQLIFAWKQMESAYPEHRYDKKSDPKVKLQHGAEYLRFLVEFLAPRDRNAITALEPHIDALAAAWEDHVATA